MSFKDVPPEARPREKLLARGAAALSDTELLAIVLRTGTAGRGVLALAGDLLHLPQAKGIGGLAGLLQAQREDLQRIKGLGPAKQAELLAIMELARRALAQQLALGDALQSPAAVRQYLQAQLAHRPQEVFAVLFLDSQLRLIAFEELSHGTLTAASVFPREIARRALLCNAHSLILAHNHPSGTPTPSAADIDSTRRVREALALLDVQVLDHIIVAQGQSLSLAEQGLL